MAMKQRTREALKVGAAIAAIGGVIAAGYLKGGFYDLDRISEATSWDGASKAEIESALKVATEEPKKGAQTLLELAASAKEKGHPVDSNRLRVAANGIMIDWANEAKHIAFNNHAYLDICVELAHRDTIKVAQYPAEDYATAAGSFKAAADALEDAAEMEKRTKSWGSGALLDDAKYMRKLAAEIDALSLLRAK